MKKILSLIILLFAGIQIHADGGMWLLTLMKEQHLADSLKRAGLKIPLSDLYSPSRPSLKDVIGIFGNGCTGDIVSPNGLLFTNNHCGYSYVHDISTLKNNYLKDGYFAHSINEELPVKGLTYTRVLKIEEVTKEMQKIAKRENLDEYVSISRDFMDKVARILYDKSPYAKMKGTKAEILPFFSGNRFFIFYQQVFSDIRLVVNPPLNVAQFGGDQDNWVWPRQNPDFALFRIYADKNGQPANYSVNNKPLHCNTYLPISLKGIQKNDFTMVSGYPGRTRRFLSPEQLKYYMDCIYRPIQLIGEAELRVQKEAMDSNDTINLKLQDEHMSLQNMVKNFGGAIRSVQHRGLYKQKLIEEQALCDYATKHKLPIYKNCAHELDSLVRSYRDSVFDGILVDYAIKAMFSLNTYNPYKVKGLNHSGALSGKHFKSTCDSIEKLLETHYNMRIIQYKKNLLHSIFPIAINNAKLHTTRIFLSKLYKNLTNFFNYSIYRSPKAFAKFIQNPDSAILENDPSQYIDFIYKGFNHGLFYRRLDVLSKIYTEGLVKLYHNTKAPDANFSWRLTYGHVTPLHARDAVFYDWHTTLDGMFEKENSNDSDYVVNPRMRKLYQNQDFGIYARKDGKLPACFITNNDITGGNSGSAVLNANGQVVGLAFDGNIESLSSDFAYDPQLQRCINVDIRYVLWIIDKFGGSKYAVNEMQLIK